MDRGFFLHDDQESAIQSMRMRDLLKVMRRTRATQQWIRYTSNWPIALKALHQLWEAGKVSELKSPFWDPTQKPANK